MLSNVVAAVNWEFLKTTPTGDMYRFTRKIPAEPTDYSGYPAYQGEQQTTTKEIVYTGRELVIWQNEQQRIAIRPAPNGDDQGLDAAAAQVARLKLEEAQAALMRAKAAYDAGTASPTEYRAARLAKDIAEGELLGNTAAILRARLQFAEEEYVQAETKDKAGLATIGELDKAKLAKEVAEANLAGDPVAAARAELQFAERELLRAKKLLEVGKVTRAEVEKARAARDIAAAELSRESGRAVKAGADGGGDDRGRPGLKASQPVPDKPASTNSEASKNVGRKVGP